MDSKAHFKFLKILMDWIISEVTSVQLSAIVYRFYKLRLKMCFVLCVSEYPC